MAALNATDFVYAVHLVVICNIVTYIVIVRSSDTSVPTRYHTRVDHRYLLEMNIMHWRVTIELDTQSVDMNDQIVDDGRII